MPVSLRESCRAVCVALSFVFAACGVPDPGHPDTGLGGEAAPPVLPVPATQRMPAPKPAPEAVDPPPAGANRSPEGLVWKRLREPAGTETAAPDDVVAIRFTGWSRDGSQLETTEDDEVSARALRVSEAMPGWKEMLTQMRVGERRRVWIPERLAAKNRACGTSLYEIELLAIRPKLTALAASP